MMIFRRLSEVEPVVVDHQTRGGVTAYELRDALAECLEELRANESALAEKVAGLLSDERETEIKHPVVELKWPSIETQARGGEIRESIRDDAPMGKAMRAMAEILEEHIISVDGDKTAWTADEIMACWSGDAVVHLFRHLVDAPKLSEREKKASTP